MSEMSRIELSQFGQDLFDFRWFKFTLKPPYSIAQDKLKLAIWDTSFLNFLGHIWS